MIAFFVVAVLVLLVWRSYSPEEAVNLADFAAVALAGATAVTAVLAWALRWSGAPASLPADAGKAADVLAGLVERQWREEARNRLLDDPVPISVGWKLTSDPTVTSSPRLIGGEQKSDLEVSSGDITRLGAAFRSLARRRIVMTGGAGMGKTTLAVQLLLHLLATRPTDRTAAGQGQVVPVPVLFPVSGWDVEAYPRLQSWLAARLDLDYPALRVPELGTSTAALVQGGHILPVLDGLDEVSAPMRARIFEAVNSSLGEGDGMILTSRRAEFTAAVREAGRPLTGAAVIVARPLSRAAAADYLAACLPAHPPSAWTEVLAALRSGSAPALAELSGIPMWLWLIRTVFMAPGADPRPLAGPLGQDATALRTQLLDRLIPALIKTRPPDAAGSDRFRPRRRWDPDRTRDHLSYLAGVLHGRSTYDLAWWRLSSDATPEDERRRVAGRIKLVAGFAVGLPMGLAFGLPAGLAVGLVAGLVAAIALARRLPARFASGRRRKLTATITAGITVGITFLLPVGLPVGLALGLEAGLPVGLMGGLPIGLTVGFAGALAIRLVSVAWVKIAAAIATWLALSSGAIFAGDAGGVVLAGLVGGLVTWAAPHVQRWFDQPPGYADLRLSGRMAALARRLSMALVFIVAFPFTIALAFKIAYALTGGRLLTAQDGIVFAATGSFAAVVWVGVGIALLAKGAIEWLEQPASFAKATSPLALWKSDRSLTLLRTTAATLLGGLGFGLLEAAVGGVQEGITEGLAPGLVVGLVLGLRQGRHHAWMICKITNWRLAWAGHLPRNLMAFLDDAHRLGLLRTAGPVYQFRHAVLHDHLAAAAVRSSR
uniref:Transcriptional regulator, XRE family n=1 Tax=Nonomuraea gerenzanensis TaxID=93944 RepID=A0A1M4EAU6_9ACTN|nr:transcriptional regulator, XRE family [Nonomuraea gerenzanensis]